MLQLARIALYMGNVTEAENGSRAAREEKLQFALQFRNPPHAGREQHLRYAPFSE